jgi:hypothetical protein
MQLYLDDDSVDSSLIPLPTAAGHDVLIPAAAGTAGQDDAIHLCDRFRQIGRS